jgi:hypothetical protein
MAGGVVEGGLDPGQSTGRGSWMSRIGVTMSARTMPNEGGPTAVSGVVGLVRTAVP